MSGLRHTEIRRVLYRPYLLLGGERNLVLVTGIACSSLIVLGLNIIGAVIGTGIWLVSLGLLRLMAKFDPQLSQVYLRYIKYQPYYPARSRPARGELRC